LSELGLLEGGVTYVQGFKGFLDTVGLNSVFLILEFELDRYQDPDLLSKILIFLIVYSSSFSS